VFKADLMVKEKKWRVSVRRGDRESKLFWHVILMCKLQVFLLQGPKHDSSTNPGTFQISYL
jgi:hypothetical protein